jgi:hypothetical protein
MGRERARTRGSAGGGEGLGAGSRHRTCTYMHDFPLLFREVAFWGVTFGEVAYAFDIISFSIFHWALNKTALTSLRTVVYALRAFYK